MESSVGVHRRFQSLSCYDMENMVVEEANEGCSTPTREEYKIHVGAAPPPPPRKKAAVLAAGRKRTVAPEKGYFNPPDLDSFFAAALRPACKPFHA